MEVRHPQDGSRLLPLTPPSRLRSRNKFFPEPSAFTLTLQLVECHPRPSPSSTPRAVRGADGTAAARRLFCPGPYCFVLTHFDRGEINISPY
ncbi:hypothetical protein J6590_073024 [Homalodisca vitripennis]|nr:hypothetical protein J6590_073024 [Homalodisca vitripennis]